jgi:hypothetical protein
MYCVHVVINKASWSSAFLRIIPSTSSIILSSWSSSKNRNSTFSRIQVPLAFTRQKSDKLSSSSSSSSSNIDIDSIILSELNSNQRKAVTSPTAGITRVVAGPGAGKENTHCYAYQMLKEVPVINLLLKYIPPLHLDETSKRKNKSINFTDCMVTIY